MPSFKARTSCPSNNKHFIRQVSGGWNSCIQGNPTKSDANVLANCVGYANGRFNEIYAVIKNVTGNKYNTLNCNAENFIERAIAVGLQIVSYPVPGGIMVWQKGNTLSGSDGAGHVAICEYYVEVDSKGYPTKVYTSESGYGSSYFWNSYRSNSNGRWGLGSGYKWRGCIVNPAVGLPELKPDTPTPPPSGNFKFNIGDKVVIDGPLYVSSVAGSPSGSVSNKVTTITRRVNAAHPYNTTGDLGWMDESSIKKYEEPKPTPVTYNVGDTVIVTGVGKSTSYGEGASTKKFTNCKAKIIYIREGRAYPYALNCNNNMNGVTGWFKASDIRK